MLAATATKRILLVDDHPIVRRGMVQLIDAEPDLGVCGEAEDINPAIELTSLLDPDIVIVDITLKTSNGLDLITELKRKYPFTPALVVSMHDEEVYAERSLRAGARGYVMKQDGDENIVRAIRKVLDGGVYVSESFSQRMLEGIATGSPPNFQQQLAELSEREFEVFRAIGEGKTPREIAQRLDINVKTIETYRRRIRAKLGIQGGNQLRYRAFEWVTSQSSPAQK